MRLGIFGGTFDPPHVGHLVLAQEALWQLELDQVIWLLTPVSPLKSREDITPWQERWLLLVAATRDNPQFRLSRVDIERPEPTFAYESVQIIRKAYPSGQLIYLVGGDSLQDLPKWEKPQQLVSSCDQIGVMHRSGSEIDLELLEKQVPGLSAKLVWVDAPLIEISASTIRQRLRNNLPVRYFLPPAVYQTIKEKELYR